MLTILMSLKACCLRWGCKMKDNNNHWLNEWKKQKCNDVFESSLMNIGAGVCVIPSASHIILNSVPYTCTGCPYKKNIG